MYTMHIHIYIYKSIFISVPFAVHLNMHYWIIYTEAFRYTPIRPPHVRKILFVRVGWFMPDALMVFSHHLETFLSCLPFFFFVFPSDDAVISILSVSSSDGQEYNIPEIMLACNAETNWVVDKRKIRCCRAWDMCTWHAEIAGAMFIHTFSLAFRAANPFAAAKMQVCRPNIVARDDGGSILEFFSLWRYVSYVT